MLGFRTIFEPFLSLTLVLRSAIIKGWRAIFNYKLPQGAMMKGLLGFSLKVWRLLKPFHKHFAVMLGFLGMTEVLRLLTPYLLGAVLNGIQGDMSLYTTLMVALISLGVSLLMVVTGHFRANYDVTHLSHNLEASIDQLTLTKVQSLSIGQHISQHSGITSNVIHTGRAALINLVNLALFQILPLILSVFITVGALMWFDYRIGILLAVVIAAAVWFSFFMNSKFWEGIIELRDLRHRNGKFHSEILHNLSLVQVQAQEARMEGEFKARSDEHVRKNQGIWLPYMKYASAREVMLALTRFSVLFIGIVLVFREGYPVGNFVILWAWTSQALSDISSVSHYQRQWMRLSGEIEKYLGLMDVAPDIVVVANPVRPERYIGQIEFREVSFSYRHRNYIRVGDGGEEEVVGEPALRQVSFKIKPGERVAFVGESGAGKSTIINLLVRAFDPDEGQILVDGQDLRLLDLKHFREAIGLVEQRVELFDETLRYNVLFGLNGRGQHVSEAELKEVAKASRINRFEHRLTKNWETWLGEKGVRLSGGERQRVGIARALIKQSSILILDEATSSLDAKNERLIKDAVSDASIGRTTIVIAHRLSTVRDADRIYVMDRGQIVATGRHEELCEHSDTYRELVGSQLFIA